MLRSLFLLCIGFIITNVSSSPVKVHTGYTVKETHFVPAKWNAVGRPPEDHKLHLQIGLKQGNFEELERHLFEGTLPIFSYFDVILIQ